VASVKVHHFRSEVVEEDGVALKTYRGSRGENHQEAQHWTLFGSDRSSIEPSQNSLHSHPFVSVAIGSALQRNAGKAPALQSVSRTADY
jgi:hypothetical protein